MFATFLSIVLQLSAYLLAWPLLWYCLMVSRDWRQRKFFSDGTRHLNTEELRIGYVRNFERVQTYVQSWPKPEGSLRRAHSALVMATVLRHHMLRDAGQGELPGYLRLRREILREARRKAA